MDRVYPTIIITVLIVFTVAVSIFLEKKRLKKSEITTKTQNFVSAKNVASSVVKEVKECDSLCSSNECGEP